MKNFKSIMLIMLVLAMTIFCFASCESENDMSQPSDTTTDSVHEHVFGEATCTKPATCECGETKGEALGHKYKSAVTAPTCTEDGYTTYTCACGDTYKADEVKANGHTYESVVTAPTCTEDGYTTYTCACGDTYKADEVKANGHTYESVVTAPTCTEDGYTTYTCACGDTYKADEVKANGHTFINGKCACGADYSEGATTFAWTLVTELKDGDRVLIGAAAYGKLLSTVKTGFYNIGVDYSANDFSNVTDAEIFVVTVNADNSYTFTSLTGDVIALADSYSSLNVEGAHKSWTLTAKGDNTFLVYNTGRKTYLEWYNDKNNWSTYTAGDSDMYYLSFYAQTVVADETHVHNHIASVTAPTCTKDGYTTYTCACGDSYKADEVKATGVHEYTSVVTAPTCTVDGYTTYTCACGDTYKADEVKAEGHKHTGAVTAPTCTEDGYTTYTCACGDTYKADEVKAEGHKFADGSCSVCGAADPDYVKPDVPATPAGGEADFDTITTTLSSGGDGGYTKSYTTANGWVTLNTAIQVGGVSVANPAFPVIGPDNTHKAVCLNGKVGVAGKLTSPLLTTGISKLTINYTKMFTDTELSVTVTITDAAGNKYTHVIENTLPKDEKYVVYTDEWVLDTPVVGEFTIEIVNNCPSNNSKNNKDRFTILDLSWEGAAAGHTHEYTSTTTATCTEAGVTTYTCSCGDTYTEETPAGHVDANLDVECDREGCTSKVAPPADSILSNFTANNLGSKLSTSSSYYVVGTIVEVLDAKNGIFLIDDGTGEKFYFRLPKNAEGVSHANWEIKLVLGDKVKLYGKINKYSTSSAPNGQYWPAMQAPVVTVLEQHAHDFTFSPAGCSDPAYCACGQSFGDPLGCADATGDDLCDDCGKNVKFAYEYVEIRTDNNSGVHDATALTYTWDNDNFTVQVAKAAGGNLYVTAKDHMRLYKGNNLVLTNKNGKAVKTITVYLTNATQVANFEKFLAGHTYTTDAENFTVTITVDSFETLTLTNPSSNGSTTQIKGVEFGYEK